jgi:hypothetical protein
MTSQVLEEAERQAPVISEQSTAESSEIGDLRAQLDSMSAELSRVVAYFSENLPSAPARPKAEPRLPGARAALPAAPARPDTAPGIRPDRPAKPRTAAGPRTTPTRAPAKAKGKAVTAQQRQGRQKRAMRVAKYGSAALILVALGASGLELHHNGYGFFVFRENGQGDSPSSGPGRVGVDQLDNQFLAAQAAARAKAAHHAPGRHAKTSASSNGTTATSTTGG